MTQVKTCLTVEYLLRKYLPTNGIIKLELTIERQIIPQVEHQYILHGVREGGKMQRCRVFGADGTQFYRPAVRITSPRITYRQADFVDARASVGMVGVAVAAAATIPKGPGPIPRLIKAQILKVKIQGVFGISIDAVIGAGEIVNAEGISRATVDGAEAVVGVVG